MTTVTREHDLSAGFSAAVDRAAPAVVRVGGGCGVGVSGTVWNADGIVVTSRRALGREDDTEIATHDGKTHSASLIGDDPGTDVAVLRAADTAGLAPLEFRDLGSIKVGDVALALGRPGKAVRASSRIVGVIGPEHRTPAGGRLDRYIETDRGLPRGFSGGPLVDLDGTALGMNTRGLVRGADLVVPGATLSRVVDAILAHGSIRRGHLGVAVFGAALPAGIRAEAEQRSGALVVAVEESSPAEASGLVLGDVIITLAGEPVASPGDLRAALQDRAGQEVAARILRAGALQDLTIAVGTRG